MAEKQLWIEADYFENFHCKGGACRNSCCSGWDIAVSMQDYFKLIGMDCDPEIHHRLECAFHTPEYPTPEYPTPERYRLISPNWTGRCPLQDEQGLCALQLSCGETALPEVCRVYPRSLKREGSKLQACCSASCEAVVEMLMGEDKLAFRLVEMDARAEIGEDADENTGENIRRCVKILQDRGMDLRQRVEKICCLFGGDRVFLDGKAGLRRLMEILKEIRMSKSRSFCECSAAAIERYEGEKAWELLLSDIRDMERKQPLWTRHFENLLVNHVVYTDFPHADSRLSIADACAGLCLLLSAMIVVTAAHTFAHPEETAFADVLAGLFHLAEHSAFYYNSRVLTGDEWILI